MHTQACESRVNHSDIISSNSTCFQYRVCPLTPVESRDQLAPFHPTKQFLDTQPRNKKRAFSRWRTQLLSKTDRKEQYNDKMNVSGLTIMPVRDVNGKRDKGQCDLPGLQMCLGFISGTPLKPTGLKHPKATCFRGIVHINTQGSGSPQMVIRCDRYQARGLTLFKGQGASVRECVCVSQRMTVSVMWRQRESQLFFLFFIRQKLWRLWSSNDRFLSHCSQCFSGKRGMRGDQTISHQWIHHHLRIQSSWPFLSLPIWWPAEDWWRERPRVRADTPMPCHHDGENLSTIIRMVSVCIFFSPLPLMKDGMENEKRGLILKYQFPGWSRIIYGLSVSFVILLRFDLR